MKSLLEGLGSANMDCRADGTVLDPEFGRGSYLFNTTIDGIEDADAILIVGSNPRFEASVLNARIRKAWRATGLPIGVVGPQEDLRYGYEHLGAGPDSLKALLDGSDKFAAKLKRAKKPMIIIGQGALTRKDSLAVLSNAAKLADAVGAVKEDWNGFNILHTAAGRVGGLDLGFVPGEEGMVAAAMAGGAEVLFLLGADDMDIASIGPEAFVVYVGTHGDAGAHRADVILPSAAYTEKSATYVNTEGRVQMTGRGSFPPGEAKEEWAIFRALSALLDKTLPFDSLSQLRSKLYAAHPHFSEIDSIAVTELVDLAALSKLSGRLTKAAFVSPVRDFYLTNPICRASATMADCSKIAAGETAQAAE
mgnify:CR=1 FL=1